MVPLADVWRMNNSQFYNNFSDLVQVKVIIYVDT